MRILVQKEEERDPGHIFQHKYFESSQIHQVTIIYQFEHANDGIHLHFLI